MPRERFARRFIARDLAIAGAGASIVVVAYFLLAASPPARAQDGSGTSLSQLKAPVCMSDQELTAYLTALALATSEAILDRCKAAFAGQLDAASIAQIEAANRRAAERPGEVMRKANATARGPFERAHPGNGGGAFAEVLQGDLDNNMRRSRSETLEGCDKVMTLWSRQGSRRCVGGNSRAVRRQHVQPRYSARRAILSAVSRARRVTLKRSRLGSPATNRHPN